MYNMCMGNRDRHYRFWVKEKGPKMKKDELD